MYGHPNRHPPPRRAARAGGFTIVELMATIAIAGILAAIASPPMIQIVNARRLDVMASQFDAAVRVARAEAIRRATVIVLKSSTGSTWTGGMHIYIAAGLDPSQTPDYNASPSPVIRWYRMPPAELKVNGTPPDRLAFDAQGRHITPLAAGVPTSVQIQFASGALTRTLSVAPNGVFSTSTP